MDDRVDRVARLFDGVARALIRSPILGEWAHNEVVRSTKEHISKCDGCPFCDYNFVKELRDAT